jgi:hypothetical protein
MMPTIGRRLRDQNNIGNQEDLTIGTLPRSPELSVSIFGPSKEEIRGTNPGVPHQPESVAAIRQTFFDSGVVPSRRRSTSARNL